MEVYPGGWCAIEMYVRVWDMCVGCQRRWRLLNISLPTALHALSRTHARDGEKMGEKAKGRAKEGKKEDNKRRSSDGPQKNVSLTRPAFVLLSPTR